MLIRLSALHVAVGQVVYVVHTLPLGVTPLLGALAAVAHNARQLAYQAGIGIAAPHAVLA